MVMSVDTIGDFLTIMRNGLMVGKRSVVMPHSNLREDVARVLKEEGYIKDYKKTQEGAIAYLTVMFKYVSGESVLHEMKRVSTPGRRVYEGSKDLTSVMGGLGVSVVTTSKGLMSDRHAKELGIGGEVICHIW